ncbi:MAG: D-glycerate dehydrogenase [Proteobacteria bacterium]|nr:D-glycerate dehydrogenase [Pseudomonadota bacterium]
MKPNVFITRNLPGLVLKRLENECVVDIWPEETQPPQKILLERARNVDGLLCLLTDQIDKAVMDAAGSKLKVVSNYAVGFDNIDIRVATAGGIPVGNTPGVLTETTADLAFALLMSAARRLVEGAEVARSGKWRSWSPTLLLGCDVYGATLGILGMGRIGRAVARRAHGFGMRVISHSSNRQNLEGTEGSRPGGTEDHRRVSFDELISEADFLSLHVPLKDETRGLIDHQVLREMKSTAVLINTARGPVIDHDALYCALKEGQIACAALDVTEPEPLPADHRLHTLDNCLILPHLGSASVATRSKMTEMATLNLLAGLRGERLPHCVNPEVYENS